MEDNYKKINSVEFIKETQKILDRFSDPIDLIMFKYDIMNLIKNKIKTISGDCLDFELSIDKNYRLKHNEQEIFEATYIIELIKISNIPEINFLNFINEIEEKAKNKKSYKEIKIIKPKL